MMAIPESKLIVCKYLCTWCPYTVKVSYLGVNTCALGVDTVKVSYLGVNTCALGVHKLLK